MRGVDRGRCYGQTASGIPHLQKQGTATQLIVDGDPFLAVTGELGNNTATSLENMQPIWPKLVAGNLNCVLAAVHWAQMEPAEGQYEFALVDGLIQEARRNNLKLVFLWFGSWKNGLSSYVPYWVKKDYKRFPRIQIKGGKSMELLSTFGDATRDADARAYRALMRHIKEVDGQRHTVRDDAGGKRSGRAARLARPVRARQQGLCRARAEGTDGLSSAAQGHAESRNCARCGPRNGFKTSGTWEEVFGPGKPDSVEMPIQTHQPADEPPRSTRQVLAASCTGRWTRSSWPGTTPGS